MSFNNVSMAFILFYLNLSSCKTKQIAMKYAALVLKGSIELFN